MHEWGRVELRQHQQRALDRLEGLLARQAARMPICLVGDFASGKTTVGRYWLSQHFDDPCEHYCAVGRPVLDALKREGGLQRLSDHPEEARVIIQLELAELFEERFRGREALVIDAIDVLMPFRVALLGMVQAKKLPESVAVICVPHRPAVGFEFSLPPAEHHRISLDPPDSEDAA